MIVRARNLRAAANYIPTKSFRARKVYFNNEVCVSVRLFFLKKKLIKFLLMVLTRKLM